MTRETYRHWRWLGALVALALSVAVGGHCTDACAELLVSPPNVVVELGKSRPSGTITVKHTGTAKGRFRARASHFEFSESGALQFVRPDENSLAPFIRFNPTEFEMAPNSKRVVRYTVMAPKDLEDGEYWGGLEFEPLEAQKAMVSDADGKAIGVNVVTSVLVIFLGRKGDLDFGVELIGAKLQRVAGTPTLVFRARNTGNAKMEVSADYTLLAADGTTVGSGTLERAQVFPDAVHAYRVPLAADLSPGEYSLNLALMAPQLKEDIKAQLSVPWQ